MLEKFQTLKSFTETFAEQHKIKRKNKKRITVKLLRLNGYVPTYMLHITPMVKNSISGTTNSTMLLLYYEL